MTQHSKMDDWLKERVYQYDQWLADKKIPYASKIIPVGESLIDKQWILPTEQVFKYILNSRSFSIAPCACRTHYQRCSNPIDICISLNDISDKLVEKRYARRISLDEMLLKLKQANEHGLVHLTLYNPDHHPYAICSCCRCCCHDLQLLIKFNRKDLIAKSEYIAIWDSESCSHCGICVDRCVFGARFMKLNKVEYNLHKCYGCGLCVTACPNHAIRLERKTA